jgi:curved DNA-binding protein CbpA
MMSQDYYEILQVHPRADTEAIAASYRRLCDLYDPARLDGAADELVLLARQKRDLIERAYVVLGDPQRRAQYDADQTTLREAKDQGPKTNEKDGAFGPSSLVVRQKKAEELLDYRPLPPAKRQERPRDFVPEPAHTSLGGTAQGRLPRWAPFGALAVVLALVVAASYVLTSGSTPPPAQPTATPSPYDQLEAFIPQARQTAEQNPANAQAWLDLGNLLYDSVQVVRENAPDSPLYQQRLERWLEATEAYSQALALAPDNALARADMGASSCFYGAGTGDQALVRQGIAEAERAAEIAPADARVLLSLGHCLVSASPPRTNEAIASWRKIVEGSPSSPLATQAQQLIAKYQQ